MAHSKTSKRVYKKRATKKVMRGGDVCDMICPRNKKNEEQSAEEKKPAEEEQVDEEPAEEEPAEEEPAEEEPAEEEPAEEEESAEEEEPADEEESAEEEKNKGGIIGFGGKKSRKHKTRKGARKTAKKPKSAWTTFVTSLYKKKKRANPLYMFKDALKDAAKLYKK